jgi:hypothetical protein
MNELTFIELFLGISFAINLLVGLLIIVAFFSQRRRLRKLTNNFNGHLKVDQDIHAANLRLFENSSKLIYNNINCIERIETILKSEKLMTILEEEDND